MSAIFTAEERRLAEALLERKLVTRSQVTQCEQILERKRGRGEGESLERLLVVKRFADELSIKIVTDQLKGGPEPSVPGFTLLEALGHRTYRARQESVGRTVALKLFPGKDESFLREI
ncbi:MAG TPA: hypothetical protein VI643_00495, partial [Planctomycetota bacterium]|nr:hypothetical protein [Planctomycetota bacterium]